MTLIKSPKYKLINFFLFLTSFGRLDNSKQFQPIHSTISCHFLVDLSPYRNKPKQINSYEDSIIKKKTIKTYSKSSEISGTKNQSVLNVIN